MTNRELVERCNRMEFPLQHYIECTSGWLRGFPKLRFVEHVKVLDDVCLYASNPPPTFADDTISYVHTPADRIAFFSKGKLPV